MFKPTSMSFSTNELRNFFAVAGFEILLIYALIDLVHQIAKRRSPLESSV